MPSFLQSAHNFGFRDINYYASHGSTKDPRERLLDHATIGALYNSAERCDAPKCHAQTRVAVQEEILGWITHCANDAQPKKVLWMSGPAGSGKTAIAGSVAELCRAKDQLAASFFFSSFSGSRERCSKRRLITTIAYQLQQHDCLQELGRRILASIDKNPAVFQLRLMDQLEELILVPLREAYRQGVDTTSWPKAIILDGLDEVEPDEGTGPAPGEQRAKEEIHLEILSVILRAANDPAFPFRIIVVSRPERAIRGFFASEDVKDITREIFLDEKYNPDADITLFLRSKFEKIRLEYNIPYTWPAEDAIQSLVDNASGQFVYADTVVRYVSDTTNPPQAQLNQVLELGSPGARIDQTNPFAALDALYTRILNSSPNPRLAVQWLQIIERGLHRPAFFWIRFLELSPGEATYLLSNLTSLISIPSPDDSNSPYQFYHKSLSDFLLRIPRSSPIYVNWSGDGSIMEVAAIRFIRILQSRGPTAPTTKSERKVFLDHFFCSSFLNTALFSRRCLPGTRHLFHVPGNISWTRLSSAKNSVLSCDVDWWINETLLRCPPHTADRSCIYSNIITLFWDVHSECRWYRCFQTCKLWRSSILRLCQEHGWSVPGRWTLLKNRFILWVPYVDMRPILNDDPTQAEWTLFPTDDHFRPPLEIKKVTSTKSAAVLPQQQQTSIVGGIQRRPGQNERAMIRMATFPLT